MFDIEDVRRTKVFRQLDTVHIWIDVFYHFERTHLFGLQFVVIPQGKALFCEVYPDKITRFKDQLTSLGICGELVFCCSRFQVRLRKLMDVLKAGNEIDSLTMMACIVRCGSQIQRTMRNKTIHNMKRGESCTAICGMIVCKFRLTKFSVPRF